MIWWVGYLIMWFVVGIFIARYMVEDQTRQVHAEDQFWAGLAGLAFGMVWPIIILGWLIGKAASLKREPKSNANGSYLCDDSIPPSKRSAGDL